jgi:long-subunit fatty acid transport protein
VGAEYKYKPKPKPKPKWELTAGFTFDTSMSSDRTRPIVIPLGTMYRYALGFKHNVRDDLTPSAAALAGSGRATCRSRKRRV